MTLDATTFKFGFDPNWAYSLTANSPTWSAAITLTTLPGNSGSAFTNSFEAWHITVGGSQHAKWRYEEEKVTVAWPTAPDDDGVVSSFTILKNYECADSELFVTYKEVFKDARSRNERPLHSYSYVAETKNGRSILSAIQKEGGTEVKFCESSKCRTAWGNDWAEVRNRISDVDVFANEKFRIIFVPESVLDLFFYIQNKDN